VEEVETQEMRYFSYINFISHYIPRVHSPRSFAHNGKLQSWKQRADLAPQNESTRVQTHESKNGGMAISLFCSKGILICAVVTVTSSSAAAASSCFSVSYMGFLLRHSCFG
jgi:hypothetical protein